MLVLSRCTSQQITLTVPPSTTATEIKVQVVEVRGNRTRLGLMAARSVRILRDELLPHSPTAQNATAAPASNADR
ncbi:carbon storage regulator [Aureliella helgolandensis]|uniref:Carbon storage regulator n=1 Tax=Aureliella helgolandensis TaxID=2527968 RepID=A0A518G2T0_9BACT|nr:carbon storage regulator [Aureliella helgolandensis]QDV22870.1 carbon storage regulator [Aureliella helgolandensis]